MMKQDETTRLRSIPFIAVAETKVGRQNHTSDSIQNLMNDFLPIYSYTGGSTLVSGTYAPLSESPLLVTSDETLSSIFSNTPTFFAWPRIGTV